MKDLLNEFDPIAEEEAWNNLETYHNSIAKWVYRCVSGDVDPQDIYRKVIDTLGVGREDVARKCRLAARHLSGD